MSKNEKKALAVVERFEVPALLNPTDIEEEMDGLQFRFTNVKIPSGGGLAFELPGDDDDVEYVKEIEGAIVYHHPVNVYWAERYDGQGGPPDCSALDGKHGVGDPGGNCDTCHLNEWGSGEEGEGKACQNRHRVYILQEDEMFPLLISLPPTSLGNFSDFVSRKVLQKGFKTYQILTKVTLKKAVSKSGFEHSQAVFKVVGILPKEVAEGIKNYRNVIREMVVGVSVEQVEAEREPQSKEEVFKGTEVEDETPF